MNLDGSKATLIADISVDVLKSTVDIHLPYIVRSRKSNMTRNRE